MGMSSLCLFAPYITVLGIGDGDKDEGEVQARTTRRRRRGDVRVAGCGTAESIDRISPRALLAALHTIGARPLLVPLAHQPCSQSFAELSLH